LPEPHSIGAELLSTAVKNPGRHYPYYENRLVITLLGANTILIFFCLAVLNKENDKNKPTYQWDYEYQQPPATFTRIVQSPTGHGDRRNQHC
jgi:hypothetical protein